MKDSVAEEENTMENLKDILQIPMMMTSGIESGSDTQNRWKQAERADVPGNGAEHATRGRPDNAGRNATRRIPGSVTG